MDGDKKIRIEVKCNQSLKCSSAASCGYKDYQNKNINVDLQIYFLKLKKIIMHDYPELAADVDSLIHDEITYMIPPNKQFYDSSTFVKNGVTKVYTIDELFKLLGSLHKNLSPEKMQVYIDFINKIAINAAYDISTDLFLSNMAKADKGFMKIIQRWANKFVNKEYSCLLNETLFKNTLIEKDYTIRRSKYSNYNTSPCWHEYCSNFVYYYMRSQGGSVILTLHIPTDENENDNDYAAILPHNLEALREYGDISFILPDTWGKRGKMRGWIRNVFSIGHPDD